MKRVYLILLGFSVVFSGIVNSDETIEKYIKVCVSCHANNADDAGFSGPQLGGFSASYIEEQLYNFQKGMRGTGDPAAILMASAVKGLSDDEIKKLSKWASSQKGERIIEYKADTNNKGSEIYEAQCSGCHNSFMGKLMTGSPPLDYLKADYIGRQLSLFANDQRNVNDPDKHQTKMELVAKKLSKEDIELIVAFLGKK